MSRAACAQLRLVAEEATRYLVAGDLRELEHDHALRTLVLARDLDWFGTLELTDAELAERQHASMVGFSLALALTMRRPSTRAPDGSSRHGARRPIGRAQVAWAVRVIQRCAEIENARFASEMAETALGTLRESKSGEFELHLVPDAAGVEVMDTEHGLVARAAAVERARASEGYTRPPAASVAAALRHSVGDSRPVTGMATAADVLHFYTLEARALLAGAASVAPVHLNAIIGGMPYHTYVRAAEALLAFALEERDRARVRADSGAARLPGAYALVYPPAVVTAAVAVRTGLSPEEASAGVQALTLHSNNVKAHEASGAAHAPLVELSTGELSLSVSACVDAPLHFLRDEFQHRGQRDWAEATQSGRESIFRDELYGLFQTIDSAPCRYVLVPSSVKLRETTSGIVREITDIDAAVLDRQTGRLGLFQLKWQQPFVRSMSQRRSRASNFMADAGNWVRATSEFRERVGNAHLAGALQLPVEAVRDVRLFVLGRLAGHFSRHARPDARAAWGSWFQLVNGVRAGQDDPRLKADPVAWIDCALRQDSPWRNEASPPRTPGRLSIPGGVLWLIPAGMSF
jgi:hypothetical protein